jgi:hypothetical protein
MSVYVIYVYVCVYVYIYTHAYDKEEIPNYTGHGKLTLVTGHTCV